jgi:hypothetical protein
VRQDVSAPTALQNPSVLRLHQDKIIGPMMALGYLSQGTSDAHCLMISCLWIETSYRTVVRSLCSIYVSSNDVGKSPARRDRRFIEQSVHSIPVSMSGGCDGWRKSFSEGEGDIVCKATAAEPQFSREELLFVREAKAGSTKRRWNLRR